MSTLAIVLFIWAGFFTASCVLEHGQTAGARLVSALGAYACMIAGTVVELT
jgi:hypothetical protein